MILQVSIIVLVICIEVVFVVLETRRARKETMEKRKALERLMKVFCEEKEKVKELVYSIKGGEGDVVGRQ